MEPAKNKTQLFDCTIRDGGYLNNWKFNGRVVREVYRACSNAGIDFVEIGFRGSHRYFDRSEYGKWRYSLDSDIREAINGITGAKISVLVDYGKIDLDDFAPKVDSPVELVRIAAHKNNIFKALDFIEKVKEKGYLISLQAMNFPGYSQNEKDSLLSSVKSSRLDYFYISDSYGCLFPSQVEELFAPFIELDNIKIGFHSHNNLQMAFANSLEAIKIGVDIVDGTMYGMGRAAGNLPIETMVAYLQMSMPKRYNVRPVLNCIDKYFYILHKKNPWGYQLPYMISGLFKCHPNYSDDIVKRREYSIEDVWKAISIINGMDLVGYDKTVVEGLINKGFISDGGQRQFAEEPTCKDAESPAKTPKYIGRHKGKEALVLANGPSLKKYKDEIDAFIKKHDPIILGANFLAGLFTPHYHAFTNKMRFTTYVDTVSNDSALLIGRNIDNDMIKEYVKRDYETLFFKDVLEADFDVRDGVIQTNCRSISVLLIGVAIVMGAKRVFVAGMDGYTQFDGAGKTLFYDESFEVEQRDLRLGLHRWNERFLGQIDDYLYNKQQNRITIITPTAHSSFYSEINNFL